MRRGFFGDRHRRAIAKDIGVEHVHGAGAGDTGLERRRAGDGLAEEACALEWDTKNGRFCYGASQTMPRIDTTDSFIRTYRFGNDVI